MKDDAVRNDAWLLDPLMTEHVVRPSILTHEMSIQPSLNETPDIFSRRLYRYTQGTPALCGTTARLLSLQSTPFLCKALDAYMLRFHFQRYPIDIALRYFLALEHLPTESQQIDRILMAFARRYAACNPDTTNADATYFLSFALLLLHTDLHAQHARPRLSQSAFVSLASPSKVPAVVLECLYDNTSLVEFMFTRGRLNMDSRRAAERERHALYKLIMSGQVLHLQSQQRLTLPLQYASRSWTAQDIQYTKLRAQTMLVTVPSRWCKRQAAQYRVQCLLSGAVRLCRVSDDEEDEVTNGRWRSWMMMVTSSALCWCKDMPDTTLRLEQVQPLSDALCVQDVSMPRLLRLRIQQRWLLLDAGDQRDAWLDHLNYGASMATCQDPSDESLCIPVGLTLACQFVAPPMAEPMADNVYLMRAQRMLAIRQYVTTLCVRHKALVHAEEESRRYAHHLGVLTPLRKSMREYMQHAMHAALRSLRATQWELAFVACRLDFLRAEQCLLERHLHHHYV
ncbi:hypothetical protein MARU1_001766 [Malassezia arunalokei]|uniref:SEC7 domain-containing protein n=1 Tax=Malassezia arunalokei TaxID=1514897 RepID=A0AAJ6CJV6_9BASI|nr:hypothetical protein MARU1_001766 [Malassezia arunalokei]